MTTRVMLDTNAVSAFMLGRSAALDSRIARHAPSKLCISAVTYGEILYGLRNRPEAVRLAAAANTLLGMVEIVPWTSEAAEVYGQLRADMRQAGKSLQPLDMLIAAHAVSVGAILVTADKAFRHVPGLETEDWTLPSSG
jgi:tRNA(fMet)-specific endonuclease VapC